jgi:hypothetical protein
MTKPKCDTVTGSDDRRASSASDRQGVARGADVIRRRDSHNFVYGTMWPLYSPPGSTFAFEVTGGEEAFALLDNFQIMKAGGQCGAPKR